MTKTRVFQDWHYTKKTLKGGQESESRPRPVWGPHFMTHNTANHEWLDRDLQNSRQNWFLVIWFGVKNIGLMDRNKMWLSIGILWKKNQAMYIYINLYTIHSNNCCAISVRKWWTNWQDKKSSLLWSPFKSWIQRNITGWKWLLIASPLPNRFSGSTWTHFTSHSEALASTGWLFLTITENHHVSGL